jgi:hypothetical protein
MFQKTSYGPFNVEQLHSKSQKVDTEISLLALPEANPILKLTNEDIIVR